MRTTTDILAQLERAGLVPFIVDVDPSNGESSSISGRLRCDVVPVLDTDPRFASGVLYQLHKDVGGHLTEFRSHTGALGWGSLQIVIDKRTGRFHADLDEFNPYQDLVNFGGHSFKEVIPYLFRKLFRRARKGSGT